jgi:hypothetical protein
MEQHKPQNSSMPAAFLAVAGVALCVLLPFFRFGIPSGHDFEFHFNSWIEVLNHWKQGVIYPHWAALAHYGYGEARFIFYPPTSWTLGAALGAILPWKLVPAAYIWIALTLSGCSMYVLARRWLTPSDAIFAAVFYAANPYHLVIVYWRSAMAELLASAYLPLLLLLILRLDSDSDPGDSHPADSNPNADHRHIFIPLSLLMAAGWLTNLPAAVMMNYSLALLGLYVAIRRRSFAVLICPATAAVMGAALAAFYLLPAFHEQSWVNIGQVLSPGVRPQDNFLFTTTTDPDHNRFNLLVSIVAVWEIAFLSAGLFLTRRIMSRRLWWILMVWSLAAVLLMARPASFLWIHLPKLQFVQLPWRWLLALNVPLALAAAVSIRRWWLRGLICATALGLLLVLAYRVQTPWWDKIGDLQEMVDNQHEGIGNEGTDEYVPADADPDEVDQKAPLAAFDGEFGREEDGRTQIHVQEWNAELRKLAVTTKTRGQVVLRLFNYPSWRVTVNGHPVNPQSTTPGGQLLIPVAAGESQIQIRFIAGNDRRIGIVISVCALALIIVWFALLRRSPLRASA